LNRNQNIYLIGPMGAGKTSIGKLLAKKLGREFIDCDAEIVSHTGASIDLIFEIEGEAGFRKRECQLIEEMSNKTDLVISTGGGVVLDMKNRAILRSSGYVVYLKATAELLYERTKHDRVRPLLEIDDRYGKIVELLKIREPLYDEIADLVIITESYSIRKIVNQLYKKLLEDE
jgi:shikimate kinase